DPPAPHDPALPTRRRLGDGLQDGAVEPIVRKALGDRHGCLLEGVRSILAAVSIGCRATGRLPLTRTGLACQTQARSLASCHSPLTDRQLERKGALVSGRKGTMRRGSLSAVGIGVMALLVATAAFAVSDDVSPTPFGIP